MFKHYVLLLMFLLAACTGKPQYLKMHSGTSDLPKSEVALIKPVAAMQIIKVNDVETNIRPSAEFETVEYDLEFLPGTHVLHLNYADGVRYSLLPLVLAVKVEAGRKYLLRPNALSEREHWYSNPDHTWKSALQDVTDKPGCWTMKVGTMMEPKGCDN